MAKVCLPMTVYEYVEKVLERSPAARNSDLVCLAEVWREMTGKTVFYIYEFVDLPSFASIERAKRIIQNTEGRYKKDPEVEEMTKEQEKNYLRDMGYHAEDSGQLNFLQKE